MVETDPLLHSDAVYDAKRCKARCEHDVDQWDAESKKLWDGRNRRNDYHRALTHILTAADIKNPYERERERENNIDPDYQSHVHGILREAGMNDLRRNETEKENTCDENLESERVETDHGNVLPLVPENDEISDWSKRQRENVINVDEYSYDSDVDPQFQDVLSCLTEYGNAYALEDEDGNLVIYEEECSSDDVSKREPRRKMRMDREQKTNANSINENPRVDLVVEKLNGGQKGILRKRKNDGPACSGSKGRVEIRANSRKVVNRKPIKFASSYFERTPKKLLKEKNVVEEEEEEEDDDDDDDDYEDAYDYDDGVDFDVNNYYFERNPRIILKGKVVKEDDDVKRKAVIRQNKGYLSRRRSPRFNLVIEDAKPNLGKLKKMEKGKNVVSEDNESKEKPNKWFKQDKTESVGPSRPYKQEMVQRKKLKEKVKQENTLKKVVEESNSDDDSTDLEILDSSEVLKEGNCFDPSKVNYSEAGGSNGRADYRRRVLQVLNEPYDTNEYRRLSGEVKVYLETFPDLKKKLSKYRYRRGTRLIIFRGFFFWLQNNPHEGAFKPWKNAECLSVNPDV